MKALVVVSFGTSVPSARKTIEKLETELSAEFADRDFYRAFTSTIICRKLTAQGEDVCGTKETLEKLIEKGYKDILVQPTHIIPGYEYEKVVAAIEAAKCDKAEITLGKPLICDMEDLKNAAHITGNAWIPDEGILILMGHGSSHDNNMIYPALQTAFSVECPGKVLIGTVEGWPEIDDVMSALEKTDVKNVTLAPFMLVAGDHAINDMAGAEEDSWKNRLEKAGYNVSCIMGGLGEIPGIRRKYAEKAAAALLCNK